MSDKNWSFKGCEFSGCVNTFNWILNGCMHKCHSYYLALDHSLQGYLCCFALSVGDEWKGEAVLWSSWRILKDNFSHCFISGLYGVIFGLLRGWTIMKNDTYFLAFLKLHCHYNSNTVKVLLAVIREWNFCSVSDEKSCTESK